MTDENGADMAVDKVDALVIGAGPAGLMAAETLAAGGRSVLAAEAMPSLGRKFLMAGKSGLNLTKREAPEAFLAAYPEAPDVLREAVGAFGAVAVTDWATGLGQEIFTGSTGRVFPRVMKASPLLRAWLARLSEAGVTFRTRHRWTGWRNDALLFESPGGPKTVAAKTVVFALGGASWPRLGSTGEWAPAFEDGGIEVAPFQPANMGFRVDWSTHMRPHFGTPIKSARLSAGDLASRGEWVVTGAGIEGGGVYEVSRAVRDGAPLHIDLLPDRTVANVAKRLSRRRGKASLSNFLRKALGLGAAERALLMEWGKPLPEAADALARLVKSLPAQLEGPMSMDGAISTAGGVAWSALDGFELKARRGTFVAGEMLDWEAPTGGYLITACLATGRAAALQALASE